MINKNLLNLKKILISNDIEDYDVLEEKTAYHGSPYDFDNFSVQHMGKGEGHQVFGWGLYFTDTKQVAKKYKEANSKKRGTYTYKGETIDPNKHYNDPIMNFLSEQLSKDHFIGPKNIKNKIDYVNEMFDGYTNKLQEYEERLSKLDKKSFVYNERYRELNEHIEAIKKAIEKCNNYKDIMDKIDLDGFDSDIPKGKIYTVDIPEDNELLLWDKKLDENLPEIKEHIKKLLINVFPDGVPGTGYYGIKISIDGILYKKDPSSYSAWYDNNNKRVDESSDVFILLDKLSNYGGNYKYVLYHFNIMENAMKSEKYEKSLQITIKEKNKFLDLLKNSKIKIYNKLDYDKKFPDITGERLYKVLSNRYNSDKDASLELKKYGIKGHKYLDQFSRNKGEGSYNYVIWSDEAIKVLDKEDYYG
jgi:hypothetical protein